MNEVTLIIGAGDATGGAIARRFARDGFITCVTRRSLEKLSADESSDRVGGWCVTRIVWSMVRSIRPLFRSGFRSAMRCATRMDFLRLMRSRTPTGKSTASRAQPGPTNSISGLGWNPGRTRPN